LETQCWIWPPETDGGDGDSDTDGGGDGKTDGGGEGEADGGSGEGATARAEAIGETAIIHLQYGNRVERWQDRIVRRAAGRWSDVLGGGLKPVLAYGELGV